MKYPLKNIYEIEATLLNGERIYLSNYKDKVLLVVNTASKCGFTPQYAGLQKLYEKYKDQGFEILGFPCNQFLNQEPGSEKEIAEGCVINYGVTFQMFSKVDVNGKNAHPIFKFLKQSLGGFLSKEIKWNFTKFLVDSDGKPIKRFAPSTKPEELEDTIIRQLQK